MLLVHQLDILFIILIEFFKLQLDHFDFRHFIVAFYGLLLYDFEAFTLHAVHFAQENVLCVVEDILMEVLLTLVVSAKKDGNGHKDSLLLDGSLTFLGYDAAEEIYDTQVIKHGLPLNDLVLVVGPVVGVPLS